MILALTLLVVVMLNVAKKYKTGQGVTLARKMSKGEEENYLRTNFLRPIKPIANRPPPRSIMDAGSGALLWNVCITVSWIAVAVLPLVYT